MIAMLKDSDLIVEENKGKGMKSEESRERRVVLCMATVELFTV